MCPRRCRRSHSRRAGFGLLELLTTLTFLIIVLGLMVSLARFVRATSAERITRGLLNKARDALTAADPAAPAPTAGPTPGRPTAGTSAPAAPSIGADEAAWAAYARQSGPTVRRLLGTAAAPADIDTDAWGTPLCYVARPRPDIGMSPGDRPFCFSAGPDGKYLTRDDNLYSYDELPALPATRPGGEAGAGP